MKRDAYSSKYTSKICLWLQKKFILDYDRKTTI